MNADAPEIKKAYRALARQYHPDTRHSHQADDAKFIEATEAYRVLIHPERRAQYDLDMRQRWRVNATAHYRHAVPVDHENLKPFMLVLAGFVTFSLFMLFVFVAILIRYEPDKSSDVLAIQQQSGERSLLQSCNLDFSVEKLTCNHAALKFRQSPSAEEVVWEFKPSATVGFLQIQLRLAGEDVANWELWVSSEKSAAVLRIVEGDLLLYTEDASTPLLTVEGLGVSVRQDYLTVDIRPNWLRWTAPHQKDSYDMADLFGLGDAPHLQIVLRQNPLASGKIPIPSIHVLWQVKPT